MSRVDCQRADPRPSCCFTTDPEMACWETTLCGNGTQGGGTLNVFADSACLEIWSKGPEHGKLADVNAGNNAVAAFGDQSWEHPDYTCVGPRFGLNTDRGTGPQLKLPQTPSSASFSWTGTNVAGESMAQDPIASNASTRSQVRGAAMWIANQRDWTRPE
eukprot:SAG22_NODE_200_length_15420_cov_4.424581_8_plen_160_part_00